MTRAFVGIGSNIEPEKNVKEALERLKQRVVITAISTIYLTEPLGQQGQPAFYNCIVELETAFPAVELKYSVLRSIEAELGRERSVDKFAPRTIDLDLILYGDLLISTPELTLPDPDIVRRPFLAIALQELAPGLILPGSNQTIDAVAAVLPRDSMQPLTTYTDRIRKEIFHDRT